MRSWLWRQGACGPCGGVLGLHGVDGRAVAVRALIVDHNLLKAGVGVVDEVYFLEAGVGVVEEVFFISLPVWIVSIFLMLLLRDSAFFFGCDLVFYSEVAVFFFSFWEAFSILFSA